MTRTHASIGEIIHENVHYAVMLLFGTFVCVSEREEGNEPGDEFQ